MALSKGKKEEERIEEWKNEKERFEKKNKKGKKRFVAS